MKTRQQAWYWLLTTALGFGCSLPPAHSAADGLKGTSCALDVPGTLVTVYDEPHGAIVAFTNHTDDVDALRRQVRALAVSYAEDDGSSENPNVVEGATAASEFVEDGALLRLTPRGKRRLSDLRKDARELAVRLANTPCRGEDTVIPSLPPSYPVL